MGRRTALPSTVSRNGVLSSGQLRFLPSPAFARVVGLLVFTTIPSNCLITFFPVPRDRARALRGRRKLGLRRGDEHDEHDNDNEHDNDDPDSPPKSADASPTEAKPSAKTQSTFLTKLYASVL